MDVTVWHNGIGRKLEVSAGVHRIRLLGMALREHHLRDNYTNLRCYGLFSEGGTEVAGRLVEPAELTLRRKVIR